MGFARDFEDAAGSPHVSEATKQELRLARVTMEELIGVRHLVSPGDNLYGLLFKKLQDQHAALYEWCDLVDSGIQDDKNSIDELALERIRSVSATKGEIETAIENRHQKDPIRTVLEQRLKDNRYTP
jgi:hypothetical protein